MEVCADGYVVSEESWDEVRAVKTLTKEDSDVRAYGREFRTYDYKLSNETYIFKVG